MRQDDEPGPDRDRSNLCPMMAPVGDADQLFVVDDQYRVRFVNPAASTILTRGAELCCRNRPSSPGASAYCELLDQICPFHFVRETGLACSIRHEAPAPGGVQETVAEFDLLDGDQPLWLLRRHHAEGSRPESAATRRHRHRTLIEAADDAILIADAETGLVVDANIGAEKLFGRDRCDLIGRHQTELHPPGDARRYREVFEDHRRQRHGRSDHLEILHADGHRVPVSINAGWLVLEGRPVLMGIFRDMSEREREAGELVRQREFARSMVESIPHPVLVVTRSGYLLAANGAFRDWAGADNCPLTGLQVTEMGEGTWRFLGDLARDAIDGGVEKRRLCCSPAGLGPKVLSVTARVLPSSAREDPQILVSLEDLTDLLRLQQGIEQHAQELERSGAFKDLFVDLMQHDLLNGAGVVANVAELALDGGVSAETRQDLELILRRTRGMVRLIENAAVLARLADRSQLGRENGDFPALITEVVDEIRTSQPNVRFEIEAGPPCPVSINPLLREVVWNLVMNAVRYGDGAPVVIRVENRGTRARCEVADRGPGVPDELKSKIFERFARLDRPGPRGQGLGLAIARAIVEAHGGTIGVEDRSPGGGSTFWFEVEADPPGPD